MDPCQEPLLLLESLPCYVPFLLRPDAVQEFVRHEVHPFLDGVPEVVAFQCVQ